MGQREDITEQLVDFRAALSKEIPIERMIFFGSRAAGAGHKDSDVDLIIVSEHFTGMRFRGRSLGFHKLWRLEYPVDFLCYSPLEFREKSRRVSIVREAVKTGMDVPPSPAA